MAGRTIPMTDKDILRHETIKRLIRKEINGTDAAIMVSLSIRQVRRLKARVKKSGAEGIIHGNRGRESNRKIPENEIEKIEKIIKEKYSDFKPTFAAEKLEENHQIAISGEKLRQLMIDWELWKSKSRKTNKKHCRWRERKEYYGEMEQFDGSYHKWFGGKESCLLLSVDDAKGKITHAKFDYNEGVVAVHKFWLEYLKKNGLPLSIYLDKFSTYKINHPAAVDNKDLMTQFQRAMGQIGVKLITAHSPQAKGRVERMNGTLQDRLAKELKLAGATTMEDANKFLKEYIPKFNNKFSVVPRSNKDLHKELNQSLKEKLPQIFSIQNARKIHNDYTIMFKSQYFQLDEIQPTTVFKKDAVIIEEHLNGEIKINLKRHYLNYRLLPARPKKQIDVKLPALTNRKQSDWKPPKDHPWRKPFIFGKQQIEQSRYFIN